MAMYSHTLSAAAAVAAVVAAAYCTTLTTIRVILEMNDLRWVLHYNNSFILKRSLNCSGFDVLNKNSLALVVVLVMSNS